MESKFNIRNPAVKRLMREAEELRSPTSEYSAQPIDDNLFEWHFTFRGPEDSDFGEGIYHGRILLPAQYPMRPPSIIMLTPNGRFEIRRKICLSISGHHPESWQPSWSIRTALLAITGFMPIPGKGAIGSLDYNSDERRALARRSRDWKCPSCGPIQSLVLPRSKKGTSQRDKEEVQELASQIVFKEEESSEKLKNIENLDEAINEERIEEDDPSENAMDILRRSIVNEEEGGDSNEEEEEEGGDSNEQKEEERGDSNEEEEEGGDSNDRREHADPVYNLELLLGATVALLFLRRILCLLYLPDPLD